MKRSWRRKKPDRGFTLVEIMIVVAIIGMLVTMAMPAFVRARDNSQEAVCVNNLRMIETAKVQHALDARKNNGDPVGGSDLTPFLKSSYSDLKEPAGFGYVIGDVGQDPICTFGGTHVLGGL